MKLRSSTTNILTNLPQQVSNKKVFPKEVKAEWVKLLGIATEARLPATLPVRFESRTRFSHQKIAFNPDTGETFNLNDPKNIFVKKDTSPIQFIHLTHGQSPMPGTDTPAAVRAARYQEPLFQAHLVKDSDECCYAPCMIHGDFVKVESLQADHVQAKEQILKRQKELIEQFNADPELAEFILNQPGMDKFFVKFNGVHYGTVFFYELYFNDIDNIWLICQACNLKKSNQDAIDFFKDQWAFGDEFLDYLAKLKPDKDAVILEKLENKKGLAQVAIEWFWDRHTNYISVLKSLFEDVKVPIQLLGKKLDRVIGAGGRKRASRLEASLNVRLQLLKTIANIKGIDMPRRGSESTHESSELDTYLRDEAGNIVDATIDEYSAAATSLAEDASGVLKNALLEKLRQNKKQKIY